MMCRFISGLSLLEYLHMNKYLHMHKYSSRERPLMNLHIIDAQLRNLVVPTDLKVSVQRLHNLTYWVCIDPPC